MAECYRKEKSLLFLLLIFMGLSFLFFYFYKLDISAKSGDSYRDSKTQTIIFSEAVEGYEEDEYDGYIIELEQPTLIDKKKELDRLMESKITVLNDFLEKTEDEKEKEAIKKQIVNTRIREEAKNKLAISNYKTFLSIKQKEVEDFTKNIAPHSKIKNRFTKVFNGLSINGIFQSDVLELEQKGYKVWKNFKAYTSLYQSVPLIKADVVWEMDNNGNYCVDSGEECITGKGVRVGVIDTGIDYMHEDLGGCFGELCKVVGGYDFVNNDGDPMDDMGHGTHVASIIAGNGVLKGVAPDAKLYAYKVLSSSGSGYFDWIIAGIERSVDPNQDGDFSDHLDVINLSLGGPGNPDDPMSKSIDTATRIGVISVIAGGNSGPYTKSVKSPGVARDAITVAATNKQDIVADFSSRGPVIHNGEVITKPDISAPGVEICAAEHSDWLSEKRCLDDKHISISGTSMATPHVAGVVALIKQSHPDWGPEIIKQTLKNSANRIGENPFVIGEGRVNALNSILSSKPIVLNKDEIIQIENVGEVSGLYNIRGRINVNDFLSYKIEIGIFNKLSHNVSFSTLYESHSLPSSKEFLAKNLENPKKYGLYILKLTVFLKQREPEIRYSHFLNRNGNDFSLLSGWPQKISTTTGFGSTPIIKDINNDGKAEIIVRSYDKIALFQGDGSLFQGWPQNTQKLFSNGPIEPPSVGDIDGDGQDEIFQMDFFTREGYFQDGKLCGSAFELNGFPVEGWENNCLDNIGNAVGFSDGKATLYDIDNDGALEIVFYNKNLSFQNWGGASIYILKGNNSLVNGFPIEYKNSETIIKSISFPIIGRINNSDSLSMVVLVCEWNEINQNMLGKIDIYNPTNGVLKSSFSAQCGSSPLGNKIVLSLIDVDGDGIQEIGFSNFSEVTNFYRGDGTNVNGWPFFHYGLQKENLIGSDLFRLGKANIIFSTWDRFASKSFINILSPSGEQLNGWPKEIFGPPSVFEPPASVDIDGDKFPDIVFIASNGFIYGWDRFGNIVNDFPIDMDGSSHSGVAFGDVDGDGIIEMFAGLHNGTIYGWKLKTQANQELYEWPMWRHDPQNTNSYLKIPLKEKEIKLENKLDTNKSIFDGLSPNPNDGAQQKLPNNSNEQKDNINEKSSLNNVYNTANEQVNMENTASLFSLFKNKLIETRNLFYKAFERLLLPIYEGN